jgi:sulfoacetaldehyde dehydrogenase
MAAADLVVATGSSSLVKSAYSSGTPAHGAGAGNAVEIVDETADLADAAGKIARGKTFDHASSCSSENSLVIQDAVWPTLLEHLQAQGGHLCTDAQRESLRTFMWPDGQSLNRKVVAQSPEKIAGLAGLDVPAGTRFFMVEGGTIERDRFAAEKLSPVLALWQYGAFDEAIQQVEAITHPCGYGHSCGIHTTSDEHIMALGLACHVSRIMVNQSQSYANSGNYDNGMPFSLTLSCGTWGGNITTENIGWQHLLNVTWISKPIDPVVPDEDEIFGEYWAQHGK